MNVSPLTLVPRSAAKWILSVLKIRTYNGA